jgi:hypothetical protein
MKSIGLPPNVIYACLAETIVLALEGRFEVFTVGRDTEWEKVKEIYKLGLKHGMKLSAISGVKGVYSDEDIANVVTLAKKARLTWNGGPSAVAKAKTAPARKAAATQKAAPAKATPKAVKAKAVKAKTSEAKAAAKAPVKAPVKAKPAATKKRVSKPATKKVART